MKVFKIILLFAVILGFGGCVSTTQTGRSQVMLMNESEELRIGEQARDEILKKANISHDPAMLAMLYRVGKKISLAAGKPEFKWEFYLINDKSKNAFCLPGGKVFVYTGLMQIISNDDELATVLGHETAHALLRHGAERSSMNSVRSGTGLVVAIIMQAAAPKYANIANNAFSIGSNALVMLPYSRSHELEADKYGVQLMIKAGYDPRYALSFWQKMSANKSSGNDFFSTHPSDEKRIKQIKEILAQ